jgi:SAM-dependent methyltransferase
MHVPLKQVDKSHYEFGAYYSKQRWISLWHQLEEVVAAKASYVLEIGPGRGLFKAAAQSLGIRVDTLDLDPELEPDYVASVFAMPFPDRAYDAVCAFQMLEHLPYAESLDAFREMVRVARERVIVSLPDSARRCAINLEVPRFGVLSASYPVPIQRFRSHRYDGQHYWEVNRPGYALPRVINDLGEVIQGRDGRLVKTYRVAEYQFHRFFVFSLDTTR